jgi:hypothetical protein
MVSNVYLSIRVVRRHHCPFNGNYLFKLLLYVSKESHSLSSLSYIESKIKRANIGSNSHVTSYFKITTPQYKMCLGLPKMRYNKEQDCRKRLIFNSIIFDSDIKLRQNRSWSRATHDSSYSSSHVVFHIYVKFIGSCVKWYATQKDKFMCTQEEIVTQFYPKLVNMHVHTCVIL